VPTHHRLAPAWWLAALTILLEICYPLVHGHHRDQLTIATVLVFALATVVQLVSTRGFRVGLAFLVVTAAVGLAVEAVGTHTGFPFGSYDYSGSLGARVLGVPLVIPLAWTMMAWPALAAARRLVSGRLATAVVGGWALASWDLFLDPQMVAAGHWHWAHTSPGLQGIPLTNYLGWLGVSILLVGVLHSLVPRTGSDTQPLMLYLWTYGSSVLANVAFFGRPAVALTGGIGMGLAALPLLRRLR
jgi:carotene biosynthesis associated membrane protein